MCAQGAILQHHTNDARMIVTGGCNETIFVSRPFPTSHPAKWTTLNIYDWLFWRCRCSL